MKPGCARTLLLCCAFITGITLAPDAPAQELACQKDETFSACSQRLAPLLAVAEAQAVAGLNQKREETSTVKEVLASTLAGMNTGDASTPTISDFLPLLRLLLDTGSSTADLPDKIGLEWNNPIPFGKGNIHQHKLAVALVKSEMFAPLKESLQGAGFGDEASNLEDDIDQGDDIRFTLSYSPVSKSMGRDPDAEPNARLLSEILHVVSQQEIDSAAGVAMRDTNDARNKFIEDNNLDDFITDPATGNELPFSKVPEGVQARYMELSAAFITAALTSKHSLSAALQAANFYQAIDLVNNQPQLVATAEYDVRDEMTGPDEVILKVSYEAGGPSLKRFRKYQKDDCGKDAAAVACLAQYLSQESVQDALAHGSIRFKFNAEYVKRQRLEFALPDTTFAYLAESVEQLTASVGMGGYFGRALVGKNRARFDAIASYEDFSDDPLRQDRGVATLSVTYPVSPGFFLSLGAVYATKPEFRGDVDEEISARAGFTYKIVEDE